MVTICNSKKKSSVLSFFQLSPNSIIHKQFVLKFFFFRQDLGLGGLDG